MSNAIRSYLNNYAEAEIHLHRIQTTSAYQSALVVPAFEESLACLDGLLGNSRHATLLILVANAPASTNPVTQQFIADLHNRYRSIWKNQHLSLHHYSSQQDILLVDRCRINTTIPRRSGVGLARKIGADIATQLIHEGVIQSPWIHNTDADVRLPADYFPASILPTTDAAALIYPFKHSAEPTLALASILYDLSLHYYVQALRWSGSSYAYHSIGSTLAVHYLKYAQVRGFPRKPAAEDFYLLNKLAKVGNIESLRSPVLEIDARLSNRTPFGTGPAIARINQMANPVHEYLFYNPMIFVLLKLWLSAIPEIWPNRKSVDLEFLCRNAGDNRQILYSCLQASGILPIINKGLKQYKSEPVFNRYLMHWFDAFKTLKFVHFLRDNHFPSVPLQGIRSAPFINAMDKELQRTLFNLTIEQERTDYKERAK